MTAPAMPMPTPIPTPENFPVTWDSPEEAMLLWEQEQLHNPHATTPLSGEFQAELIGVHLAGAVRAMGAPVSTLLARRINTYVYLAAVPDFTLMEGVEERMKASVARDGFGMYERWVGEFLPRVEALNKSLLSFDYPGASMTELAAQYEHMIAAFNEAWDIHFKLMPGFYLATAFKGACAEMFGFTGLEAYEMMQGSWNLSVESGSKLWHLSKSAPADVRRTIEQRPSVEALAELQTTDAGRAFLGQLQEYLDVYGWRTGSFDFSQPSWHERPDLALDNVRLMFRVKLDPADDQARGAAAAEAQADECRAKLAGKPEVLGQFEFLLQAARTHPPLQENHNFYIDQKLVALCRLVLNEISGRMTTVGIIDRPDDIYFLRRAEIRTFLAGSNERRQDLVARERAELNHFSAVRPPLALGARPPVENQDPMFIDFFGRSIIEPSGSAKELKGTASSRGRVTGTARVIRTLAEAERVQEGDILVCDMTTPAWTPLFASLAAIVSDSGGPLSHCAVVAREYGVPCVTGTRIATSFIPDGATITVDGGTGLVRIES